MTLTSMTLPSLNSPLLFNFTNFILMNIVSHQMIQPQPQLQCQFLLPQPVILFLPRSGKHLRHKPTSPPFPISGELNLSEHQDQELPRQNRPSHVPASALDSLCSYLLLFSNLLHLFFRPHSTHRHCFDLSSYYPTTPT